MKGNENDCIMAGSCVAVAEILSLRLSEIREQEVKGEKNKDGKLGRGREGNRRGLAP